MCYVGAPMIYYGDEAGMWGGHDPDDRMPMVWADLKYDPQAIDPRGDERAPDEVNFDQEVFDFYKSAVALRRGHDALSHGDYSVIAADNDQRHARVRAAERKREAAGCAQSQRQRSNARPQLPAPESAADLHH